jgi:hypothetical protein
MTMRTVILALGLGTVLCAQQLKLNLDHLAAKASDSVDLSLNGTTLQFAGKFLDGKDPDEAKVKKLIGGIEGIYIRHYEFKSEGAWSQADVDQVRNQLRAPEWSRLVGFRSSEDGETAEVYVRTENKKVSGVAILSTGPKEFTVVNIAGAVDLESLAELGGHFGVPKLESKKK